ncbi:MAG: hypothetical protein Q8O70_09720, partial [Burkholderiales bacterium]|nr:hypothetical protein [Burkholderiales bacterium]
MKISAQVMMASCRRNPLVIPMKTPFVIPANAGNQRHAMQNRLGPGVRRGDELTMTLERAKQLLQVQAGFGGPYNA